MFFTDEPAWMRAARNAPMYSTWESRQPRDPKEQRPFYPIPTGGPLRRAIA